MENAPVAVETTIDTVTNAVPQGSWWGMLMYCVIVFGIIYLFMIRPNKKRMTEYKKMLDSIKVGNRVLAAGIYGTVKKVNENTIDVEINKNAVANVE